MFENKLQKKCDYVVLLYAPKHIRKKRAIKRTQISKNIVDKIMKHQICDKIKKKKSDFIINTNTTKQKVYKNLTEIIDHIKAKKCAK